MLCTAAVVSADTLSERRNTASNEPQAYLVKIHLIRLGFKATQYYSQQTQSRDANSTLMNFPYTIFFIVIGQLWYSVKYFRIMTVVQSNAA